MGSQPGREGVLFLRDGDGRWWVGWGPFTRQTVPPSDQIAFWRSDFFNEDTYSWWVPHRLVKVDDLGWMNDLWPSPVSEKPGPLRFVSPSFDDFRVQFAQIKCAIQDLGLQKLVAVVEASAEGTLTPVQIQHGLTRAAQSPSRMLVYGGWLENEGFLGCTPEVLCSWSPELVETMALAGTSPSKGDSLLKSAKDMHEHQLVIDDIQAQLGQWGEVLLAATKEWDLGLLKHLRTDMAVRAPPSFEEVVRGLHPTPALGGAPRDLAWSWLKKYDTLARPRYFGAPFGIYDPGRFGLAVVAIRQIYWRNGKTFLPTGCGIVAESDIEKEWAELSLKRRAVLTSLGVES